MSDVELYGDTGGPIGLEDFDPATDSRVPRMKILHKEGAFQDSQTKAKFETLRCIPLGLVKARVLWEPTSEVDDAKPLCKSWDARTGFPDANQDFPWDVSGFDQDGTEAEGSRDNFQRLMLPCASCGLKEFGTDPKGGKGPWCTEQHQYPMLYQPDEDGEWVPIILTVQKTGIANSRNYCDAFNRSRKPLFTSYLTLTLEHGRKGQVEWSTPIFERGEPTDAEYYADYAHQFVSIAEYLRSIPSPRDDEDETEVKKPAKKASKAAPARQRQAPAADEGDDDEAPPF